MAALKSYSMSNAVQSDPARIRTWDLWIRNAVNSNQEEAK